ncbi:MAG: ATP-binding cassette domain-containing protein [Actinomycetota bacterium]|nr:ATP-binding cassette domain-containing protein [Actinomycetota bacterium]
MSNTDPVLELRHISKNFLGVHALTDINMTAFAGETICLLGDNGAGKSTLIKIMSGVHRPSGGKLLVDGDEVSFADAHDARALGISTVHQYGGTVPLMSVARNFFLGAEPTLGWGPFQRYDDAFANRVSLEQIHKIGIRRVKDGQQLAGTLSGGERQALAIARAMYFGARVLILDEPTSALGVKEAAETLKLVMRAKNNGLAVIFITHNAHHAMTVGDRFIVLIQGEVAADFRRGERTKDDLLNLMAGGEEFENLELEVDEMRRHTE